MAQDKQLVMGIDLGTTSSCVGVWRNGRVEIVPNDQSNRTTPSCVAFTGGERLIGEGANNQVASNASNTVFDVKRLMGRSFSDESVKSDARYWPFEMVEGPDDKPKITVSYHGEKKELSPEEISAMLLVKMKETAEAYVGPGATINKAVVSVPAYFNGAQRQATMDAGTIAGLEMRIINEPSAAAIAYILNRKWSHAETSTVLVYDLGGGTLDVSLIVIHEGKLLQVMAVAGDSHLGGEDFTNNMVDHFVAEFKDKNQRDMSGDKRALGRLRRSCEEAKRRLSTNLQVTVEVDALYDGIDLYATLSRDQFEELNKDLFRRCKEPIAKCLRDAKMDVANVYDVVLVGGCTRIPCVRQLLEDFFGGKELCRNINADEAVAYGASFQAGMLVRPSGERDIVLTDVTPFAQGINVEGGLMSLVVPRNATIHTKKEMGFTTTEDTVDITVYEGESGVAKKFRVSGITLPPKGVATINVGFVIDRCGILHVSAEQENQGKISTTNEEVGRFSMEEIRRMWEDAHKYKAQDEEHKKKAQARDDIESLLFTMRNTIEKYKEESAAARLVADQEATREEEGSPEPQEDSRASKWDKCKALIPSFKTLKDKAHDEHKAPNNNDNAQEKKKMTQPLKDAAIKKLRDIDDEATKWLENKERTTSEIIDKKKQIEGDYNNITSPIECASP